MATAMLWGIKASLIGYVAALDDGSVEAEAPAERRGDAFWFPAAAAGGELEFAGAIRLRGHWGMLDLEVREPRMTFEGDRGTLLVHERGRDGFLPFADLVRDAADAGTHAESPIGVWRASLTGHGAQLIGGQYPAGTELDPVRIEGPAQHD